MKMLFEEYVPIKDFREGMENVGVTVNIFDRNNLIYVHTPDGGIPLDTDEVKQLIAALQKAIEFSEGAK